MKRAALAATALGFLALGAAPAMAVPYADGLVVVNEDKQFTFDSCSISSAGNTSGITACTQLNVQKVVDGTGTNKAWGFSLDGLIAAIGGGSFKDITLHYHVDVLDPKLFISDAHLVMTGSASNLAFVDESLLNGATPEGSLHATGLAPSDSIFVNSFPPGVKHLDVTKDYGVIGFGDSGITQISAVRQTFTQTGRTVSTPEPATLALFGMGLAGLGAMRRRRKSA